MCSEFLKAHRELVTACGRRVDSKGEGLIVNDEGAPYNGLMTPRKRVLAALNYREPDRVPVDLSGYRSCGVAVSAPR